MAHSAPPPSEQSPNMSRFSFYGVAFLRLLLKVTEVTTEHQKRHKIGKKNSIKSFFSAQRVKKTFGRSPLQELEVSLLSGLYLLVYNNNIFCLPHILYLDFSMM